MMSLLMFAAAFHIESKQFPPFPAVSRFPQRLGFRRDGPFGSDHFHYRSGEELRMAEGQERKWCLDDGLKAMRVEIVPRSFSCSTCFSFLLIFIVFRSVPHIMRLEWQIWSSPQVLQMDRRSLNLIQCRSHAYWNRGGWSRNARNEQNSKWIRIWKRKIMTFLSLL